LWKHRAVTLRPRFGTLGLIAVPQTWLFQFLFSAIAPLVDLTVVWRLALSGFDLVEHRDQFDWVTLQTVLIYYLVFLAVDLGGAALALAMERKEKAALLPWLVLQRFGYRQLMYYIVVKAGVVALLGPLVGWGKLDRKSTVEAVA
jgi:hypothetical protein